jgi:hypothetical protein
MRHPATACASQVWRGTLDVAAPSADPSAADGAPMSIPACAHLFVPPALRAAAPGYYERYAYLQDTLSIRKPLSKEQFVTFWKEKHPEGSLVHQGAGIDTRWGPLKATVRACGPFSCCQRGATAAPGHSWQSRHGRLPGAPARPRLSASPAPAPRFAASGRALAGYGTARRWC